ncbi:MAG: hypothetical protein JRE45_19925 [Deltaproteobacteria bacterium]|nr:hypothetical protein [Deltaproteobacteria bacterium]MBW2381770.1 hypothetical protein [Deltaproteobacteria bacterium]MBW2552031.1 hypothetical protein [Deltaproteobacteria bacterium]MBW2629863.1 hypothetical protein [Deltaproteobacteria bacterium]MBW2687280.1 hypothetical protein [Deltaproteobacteria bacterium]
MKLRSVVLVLAVSLPLIALGCSSDGGVGSGTGISRILGQALAPETTADETKDVPLPGATVVLLEYDENGNLQSAMVGTTDADGNFVVDVQAQAVVAIVVNGMTKDDEAEVSGLYNPNQPTITKDLDPATSIACTAGLTAVGEGSITEEQLDETRVQNLEDGAEAYIATHPDFDFYDPDQVATAVEAVRVATNDGANPPP